MRRIAGFDGLRALAAAAVVCTHLGMLRGLTGTPLPAMLGGYRAVHLFFALSGFLITALLIREQGGFGRVSIRDFYARRAFRILPIYLLCVGLTGLLHGVLGGVSSGTGLAYAAAYIYNFMPRHQMDTQLVHTWSLAVEEHFYLVWPVVFAWVYPLRKRGLMQGSMLACLVALLVHQLLGTLVHKAYVPGYWTCFAGTTILMGCVVAILSCDEAYRSKAAPILRSKGVLFLSVVLWANPAIEFLQVGRLSIYMHGLGCALLVGWIYHNQQSTLVRLLEWRPLRYLGTISYGIYMYQGLLLTASPVRVDGRVWPLPPWLGFVVLCVIAPLSYHFLERPLIARGRRFRQRHLVVPKAVPDVPQVASHTPAP